jgi:predicted nucleotidyltransferase
MTLSPEEITRAAEPPGRFMLAWTKEVLEDALQHAKRLEECDYEIFLQGSYANDTNISGTSDVDLVIQMKVPFEENIASLDGNSRKNFFERYESTLYGWEDFREDVLATLRERYFVHEGDKCIDIRDWDSLARVPADILPAVEYRDYKGFPALGEEIYEEGVFFRDSRGNPIINYPKQHLRNGRRKNRATGGRFKQIIRVVKHARNRAGERDMVDPATASSYFVECLLYNVPDAKFRTSLPAAFEDCLAWLDEYRRDHPQRFGAFCCQNGLVNLFGDRSDQWSRRAAHGLIEALLAL